MSRPQAGLMPDIQCANYKGVFNSVYDIPQNTVYVDTDSVVVEKAPPKRRKKKKSQGE